MPATDPAFWTEHLQQTLEHYDEPLLRQVAGKLFKPRNQWPVEELIERGVATIGNVAVIDRRLKELDPASRRLLALIGYSRQPRWQLGHLLEMLAALGHAEGPRPVFTLFESGLLYPELGLPSRRPEDGSGAEKNGTPRLRNFEQWLGQASVTGFSVFAHPTVTARVRGEDLQLPDLSLPEEGGRRNLDVGVREADGLEWPLRLAVLWQQVAADPLRRTQVGDFFKRDLERLRQDPLLSGASPDGLATLPDIGLLTVSFSLLLAIVEEVEGELRAAAMPGAWDHGLSPALASIWTVLPHLENWEPHNGWRVGELTGNPYPSAYLLAFLLLARLPPEGWASPLAVEEWVRTHHPFWSASRDGEKSAARATPLADFLLGFAYPLRMVQAVQGPDGTWLVRLSPMGRWLLGLDEEPPAATTYPQTLTVQPNLEIIAYRQGLTPELIVQLARFSAWKSLGAACTLQLQPDTVYRALESGQTFETIRQTLEKHGMRAVPPAVIDSLRTWADKRERITIYPSATLFEFAQPDDLNEALARGLPGVRLSDRLAVVASENGVDFRHFRLTSTRDYGLPPEKCVEVEADGVTLVIDMTRSDLLLETELRRFAEPIDREIKPAPEKNLKPIRTYRLTPASLAAARNYGLGIRQLDEWFLQRNGQPLSPAARLLLNGAQLPPMELRRQLVLSVATPEVADGLLQWPGTRGLIQARLGPMTLVVAEEDVASLRERLRTLGLSIQD